MGNGPFGDLIGITATMAVVLVMTSIMGNIINNITNQTNLILTTKPESNQTIPMDGVYRSPSVFVQKEEIKQEAADYCYLVSKRAMYEKVYEEPIRSEKLEEIDKLIKEYNRSIKNC